MNRLALIASVAVAALAAPAFAQNADVNAQALANMLRIMNQAQQAANNPATRAPNSDPNPAADDATAATGPGVVQGSTTASADPVLAAKAAAAAQKPQYTGPTGKIAIGTLAGGTLSTTVNSDYPGPWKGTLTQPIYTIDRKTVLFPEGTVVVGRVARVGGTNAAINNRLALLPTELVRPDGTAFKINQNAITDDTGITGLADQVDYHPGVQIGAIGAYGVIDALPDLVRSVTGANQQNGNVSLSLSSQQAGYILQKYLELVPTVTVRAGSRFQVFFVEEMEVPLGHPRVPYQLTNYRKAQ